jgi:uncharacterized protein YcbX
MTATKTVSALWLYPVQSLRGQPMHSLDFEARGPRFDRWYGIEDIETGKMVGSSSAKREWRPLITWDARLLDALSHGIPKVEIRFPDGEHLVSDDTGIDRKLSDRLGKPVKFRGADGKRAQPRYEVAPCHLLTTSTQRRLHELCPSGDFAPERFRPTLMLDCGAETGFIEQAWLGRRMTVSSGVVLEGTEDCKRCALTTRAQGDLPKDPGILHTVVQHNNTSAGIYAKVAKAGRMALGDAMAVG